MIVRLFALVLILNTGTWALPFSRIESFKDMYIVIAPQDYRLKYQVSFAYQALRFGNGSFFRRTIGDLRLGYSLKAFGGGLDFEEYNHNPELFFERDFRNSDWGPDCVEKIHDAFDSVFDSFRIGLWEHESDG